MGSTAPAAASATDRTSRTLALAIGAGGIIYCAAETPEIITQRTFYPMWWTVTAVAAVLGCHAALAAASCRSRTAVRRAAAVTTIVYPALMLLASPFLAGGALTGTAMWICRAAVLGALAAPLALGRAWVLALLPGWTAVEALINRQALGQWTWANLGEDYLRLLAVHALFALFISGAHVAAAALDAATAAAQLDAAVTASAAAREREQNRFAALVHDSVLSTLLDASRAGANPQVLRRQAGATLTQLAVLATHEEAGTYDAAAALELFGAAVWAVDWRLDYRDTALPGGEELRLPAEAAATIAAALTEGARNSIRHAPGDGQIRRAVSATAGPDHVHIVLRDNGPGFDPGAVPPGRLGIAVSILGRMSQLPGADASVESRPGQGTTVTLSWNAPRTPEPIR